MESFKNVLDKFGITALNPMQEASLEAHGQNRDVVMLAPTGSGKTLAFLLPLYAQLSAEKTGVQALILAPSRELALQIEDVFRKMGTGFKVNCFYGGHSFQIEQNTLLEPPALLIGTPGRIADHFRRGTFPADTIEWLVLDEFDKSLELGFEQEMASIIGRLTGLKKRTLTSATRPKGLPAFIHLVNPLELNFLTHALPTGLTLKQVTAEGNDKLETLFRLLCQIGSEATLVFCNHREAAERISELLSEQGLVHGIYHGGQEQEVRERALIKFRNGSIHILLTTDLASRGLDIPQIKHVVHYQLPPAAEAFIHRNGRTARMLAQGTAFVIVSENEPLPAYIEELEDLEEIPALVTLPENPPWITLYIAAGKKEKISKGDIVGLLLQKANLQKEDVGMIEVRDHASFAAVNRTKASRAVELLKDEKIKRQKVKIGIAR